MENPCLTFVTPTLLAGDRSLVNVVAHEIAHSWTGVAQRPIHAACNPLSPLLCFAPLSICSGRVTVATRTASFVSMSANAHIVVEQHHGIQSRSRSSKAKVPSLQGISSPTVTGATSGSMRVSPSFWSARSSEGSEGSKSASSRLLRCVPAHAHSRPAWRPLHGDPYMETPRRCTDRSLMGMTSTWWSFSKEREIWTLAYTF